jgi:hypothetical protein
MELNNNDQFNNDENNVKLKNVIKLLSENKQLANNLILNTMKLNYDSEEYWKYIIQMADLSNDFILDNIDKINVKYIVMYQKLDDQILNNNTKFLKYLIDNDLINVAVQYQQFNEVTLNKIINCGFIDDDFWNLISQYQQLNANFIKDYDDKVNWKLISIYQDLNMELITEYLDKIDWNNVPLNISSGYLINDDTIKLYKKYPIWDKIGYLRNVSTYTLFKYFDNFSTNTIYSILKYRQLDENQLDMIISKYNNDDNIWLLISEYQTLDEIFVDKFQNKLCWVKLSENYDFNNEELIKYETKIDYNKLSFNDNFNNIWIVSLLKIMKLNKNVNNLDMDYLIKNDIIQYNFLTN